MGILDSKKNFRKSQEYQKKSDKFENLNSSIYRILNSSLNTYPTFWQHFTGKKLLKKVFIFLYSYQPRDGSVHSHGTVVSRVLSTEHNKSAVFQSHLHFNLSALIHPTGPSLSKKNKNFLSFLGNFRQFQEIHCSTHGYKNYLGKFFH